MKKNILILLLLSSTSLMLAQQKLKVGNNPATLNPSAALEVESTTKGFLPPRMTLVQKDAIPVSTATKGLTVYCTDCTPEGLYTYNGTAWTAVGSLSGANLTGPITSSGNATAVNSQTGTGSKFVMDTSPVLVSPTIGIATATSINGLTPTAQTTGFTIAGGTTSKTLTVSGDATVSGSNTGDQTTITGNAGTATSIAGGTLGAVPYQSGVGTTGFLAGNTTSTAKFLTSTGTGTTAAAPTWADVSTVAVPYSGATSAVDLGAYDLKVNGITVGTGKNGGIVANLNTALGKNALNGNNSGTGGNTAIGDEALKMNTTGNKNTAIGNSNLSSNTSGTFNTAIGYKTNIFSTSASYNTSLGALSLYSINTGSGNTGIGSQAGSGITSGNNNTFVGSQSSSTGMTSGDNNTIIGSDITGLPATLNNNIILADGAGHIRAQHDGTAWDLKTTVKGVTELASDNSTNLATTAFVKNAVASVTSGTIPDADSSTKGKIQLAGELSGTAEAPTVTNAAVIGKVLTGYVSGSGTVLASDSVLGAIQKVDGNVALKAPLASPVFTDSATAPTFTSTASTGTAPFTVASTTTVANLTATNATNATNLTIANDIATADPVYPTFVTANTGNLPQKVASTKLSFVPSTGTLTATKFSGDGSGLTGIIATTNANLTGPITSVGNTTSVASQTGSGSKFVMDTSPVLVTPTIGKATATSINGLTPTAQTTGFTIAGGTTSKTLTVSGDATVSGSNTGDQTTITGNAGTATSIAGGTLGAVPYQSAAGTTSFLLGNTTSTAKFLTSTGTGTTAAAPTWADVSTVAVPYSGATSAVDLGAYDLKVNGITVGVGNGNVDSNIAMGVSALNANTTQGKNNSALGKFALYYNTSGVSNVALGNSALFFNTNGNNNIAIGLSALNDTSTGSDSNIAMGYNALKNLSNSDNNIGIGSLVGYGFTTGQSNIFIGNGTSTNNGLTSGSNNTIIGSDITGLPATLYNNIILADGAGHIRAQHDGTAWDLKTTVKGVTELASDNSTNLATTAFVSNAVATATPDAKATVKGKVQLAGELSGTAEAPTVTNAAVIGKVLTGYVSGSGTVLASDSVLGAIQKVDGNVALKAPLASPLFTGSATAPTFTSTASTGTAPFTVASTTTVANLTATNATNATNLTIANDIATADPVYPTFVTANTGNLPQKVASTKLSFVPSTGTLTATKFSGDGSGLTGIIATTNANLTGPITSLGNTTSVASQTGTGSKFVMDTSPTLVTPTIGIATATSINKVTITAPTTTATLTIANGKTLTANNSISLSGTDSTTMTFPSTTAIIARTDGAQTFAGTQTFSSDIFVNSLTVGRGNSGDGYSTALGVLALNVSTGTSNTAVGRSSLAKNVGGFSNVALGSQSLSNNVSANENTAIGSSSLLNLTTFSDGNIGIGNNSGVGFTSGNYNIFIGHQSSTNNGLTSGNFNTIIGSGFTGLPTTLNNNIILADGAGHIRARYDNGWTFGNVTLPTSGTLATTADINFPAISSAAKTADYTALTTDYTILCNASTGGFTLTIPAAATANTGKMYVINKIDDSTNALTFSPALKLSSTTTVSSVNFNQTLRIQSDGTNWWIIN